MEAEKNNYNRKNVNNIKRLILVVFMVMCALPILFCLYLMMRMNSMENKLDAISEKLAEKKQGEAVLAKQDAEELLALEQEAYQDLEKSTADGNQNLTLTDGEGVPASENANTVRTEYNGKKVYLTFDDGPSVYTDELLDILKKNDVKATFFCVYNDDKSVWSEYKRIVDEGHTLGMHSYTHVYDSIYASKEAFEQDVSRIHDFLYEQTGVDCRFYRFPGGSSNSVSEVDVQDLMEYLDDRNITYYDWNALSGDAVDVSLSAEQLNETIMGYVRNNSGDSIVLMHDLRNNHATVEGLQDLIDTLKSEGYEICPIDEYTVPVQHVKYQTQD